jgi:two-component system response regulator HydG
MPGTRPRLLVVHAHPSVRRWAVSALAGIGDVVESPTLAEALSRLPLSAVDVLLIHPSLLPSERSNLDSIPRIALGADPPAGPPGGLPDPGFLWTLEPTGAPGECERAVRLALEQGRLRRELLMLRAELARRDDVQALLGTSAAIQALRDAVRVVRDTDAPVLIRGEKGSGRALVARIIHAASACRDGPLVRVHLSSLAPAAIRQELHGRGPLQPGRIEAARHGTLLLCDLEALPPAERDMLFSLAPGAAGSAPTRGPRLITTAGPRLDAEVAAGRISAGLIQSLGGVVIQVPPLRERGEDVPLLAEHFLQACRRSADARPRRLSPDALEALSAGAWPGNVRELRHVVESVALRGDGEIISRRDLPRSFQMHDTRSLAPRLPDGGLVMEKELADYERAMLAMALERAAGRRRDAAVMLGLNKDQMKYLCRKYGL